MVDNQNVPGNSRVLRTKLSPSPYVVIRPLWTTTIVKRVADGFATLYHNNIIKKYKKTSPLFATLPSEVTKVLLHKFEDFLDKDFSIITQHDPLEEKLGLHLFNPEGENLNPAPEINEIPDEYVQNDAVDRDNDSDSLDDEEDVLPLPSGKKRNTFSK